MEFEIIELNDEQSAYIDEELAEYDRAHIGFSLSGDVEIGVLEGGELIAGCSGCMTAYRIFYVSTVFVDERRRGKGIGSRLMSEIEKRAKALGANMIRLDTFDWQGAEFYRKLGYEQAGCYENAADGFREYFFLKWL